MRQIDNMVALCSAYRCQRMVVHKTTLKFYSMDTAYGFPIRKIFR